MGGHGRVARRARAGRKAYCEGIDVCISLGLYAVDGFGGSASADKYGRIGIDRTNLTDEICHSVGKFGVGGLDPAVVVAAQGDKHGVGGIGCKVVAIFIAYRPVVGEEIIVGVIAFVGLWGFEKANAALSGYADRCAEMIGRSCRIAQCGILGLGIPGKVCSDGEIAECGSIAVADNLYSAGIFFGRSKEFSIGRKVGQKAVAGSSAALAAF